MENEDIRWMESILKLLIDKAKEGKLILIQENRKKKFVYIDEVSKYDKLYIQENKCSVEPLKILDNYPALKNLEKDGYTIKLVFTSSNGGSLITKTFHTWLKGAHQGYGDTIQAVGYSIGCYLNFDNNGKEIILPKKTLIGDFESPILKYYKD